MIDLAYTCPDVTSWLEQDALITDFIALGFLPLDSDRRRILPVLDTVLSPYLRGGGARAFNFQVRHFFNVVIWDDNLARLARIS